MAQFNEPFSTSSVAPQGSPSLIEGTPAVIQYAEAVIKVLPTAYFMAVNVALEEHVEETRKQLEQDPEYSDLSGYYDVSGVVEDDGIELEFGFFGVPSNLEGLVSRLEYGDETQPPRGFVRRTVYKQFEDIAKNISTKTNVALSTETDYA
tara:strand:- start:229 stop:678 length:450 start_codon:yes stop_codon:yes gene_type:complete